MIRVAKHDHIVNFQGISMDGEKVYVLLEFCSFGAIDSFLQKNSENFRMKMEGGNYKEVVSWCHQVADAMEFLVKNNIIHVSTYLCSLRLRLSLTEIISIFDLYLQFWYKLLFIWKTCSNWHVFLFSVIWLPVMFC